MTSGLWAHSLFTTLPPTQKHPVAHPWLRPQPPPNTEQALQYRARIADATPKGASFTPLMTLYLTDNTPPEEVARAREAGVAAFKLYPAGATTNSGARLARWWW